MKYTIAFILACLCCFAMAGTASADSTVIYMPLVMSSYTFPPVGYYAPTIPSGRWEVTDACTDDTRGQLYRDMVDDTEDTLNPIGTYYASQCCTVEEAQTKGAYLGNALGIVRTILDRIFTVIWRLIVTVIDLVLTLFGLSDASAGGYAPIVTCTDNARYICFGLGAIAALDDMAGGWVTIMTGLILSVLSFWLGVYVVNEVREIIQGSGGEG